jgi:hypothetical protein
MRLRNTLILIVVAAALAGYFFLFEQPRRNESMRRQAAQTDLADFHIDEAVGVTIERPDVTLEFARSVAGGPWTMRRPVLDRAEDGAVNRLLGALAEGEVARDLGPQRDVAPFGLEPPCVTIIVVTARGDTAVDLDVGDLTLEKYHAYARRRGAGAGAGILLIPTGVRRYALGEPFTYRNPKLTDFRIDDVRSLAVSWPESTVTWRRNGEGGWSTVVDGDTIRGRRRLVDEMVRRVWGLRALEFVPVAELSVVQPFEAPPRSISVALDGGGEQRVRIGRRLESRVYAGSDVFPPAGERVVLTDTTVLDIFAQSVSDLRDRRLLRFDAAQLGRVALEAPDVSVTLVRPGSEWGYLNPAAGTPDPQRVKAAIDAIADLEFGRVLSESASDTASYGLSNPEIRLTIYDKNGGRVDRLLCERRKGSGGAFVATSGYAGVTAELSGDDLAAVIEKFKHLRQP